MDISQGPLVVSLVNLSVYIYVQYNKNIQMPKCQYSFMSMDIFFKLTGGSKWVKMKHENVLKLSYVTTKHRIITSYLDFRHVKIFCCHFLSHVVLQNKQEVACASDSFPVYRSECICLCVILCTILNKQSSKNIFQILNIIKS